MTSPGAAQPPDPADLPPAAPFAGPYTPPPVAWPAAEVPPPSAPPAWPAPPPSAPPAWPAPPPSAPPAWPAPPGGPNPTWPAAQPPGPPGGPRGAARYVDQTRSLMRGVTERVRAADQSELLRRGREAGVRQARQVRASVAAVDTGRIGATANQVGRTAAVHGVRAARQTVSAVSAFGTGVGTFWRGLWTFLTRPRLWLFALLPAVILYGVTFASEAGVRLGTRRVATWVSDFAEDWPSALRWLVEVTVHWGVGKLALAMVGFLVVPLTLFAGAPFYVLITRSLEKRLAPPGPPPQAGWAQTSGFVMSQTLLLTLVVLASGVIIAPILLIPGVNLLAASVISIVVTGFVIGLLALGLPLHHRGLAGRREHLRYAWRNRWPVIGFGGMSVLILSIPFSPLRWFTVPAVFIGAVLLQRSFPAPTPPPRAVPTR